MMDDFERQTAAGEHQHNEHTGGFHMPSMDSIQWDRSRMLSLEDVDWNHVQEKISMVPYAENLPRVDDPVERKKFFKGLMIACAFLAFVAISVISRRGGDSQDASPIENDLELGASQDLIDPLRRPRPSNVNLLFIGDSITQYMYLSFVYYLRHGRWFEHVDKPNLVQFSSFENPFHNETFNEFYFQTNRMLYPLETCDCWQKMASLDRPIVGKRRTVENRYFRDPVLDNTVTYLRTFSHVPYVHGRFDPATVLLDDKEDGMHLGEDFSDMWQFGSWPELIMNHVAKLDPRPTHVVMNARHWEGEFEVNDIHAVKETLESLGITPLWKTTPFRRGGVPAREDITEDDHEMCVALGGCLNVSWTKDLPEQIYWDEKHFSEPVYRAFNEQMMEEFGILPNGYSELTDAELFHTISDSKL